MSIENDNLPNADGQKQTNPEIHNSENSEIQSDNSPQIPKTTGENLVDINVENTQDEIPATNSEENIEPQPHESEAISESITNEEDANVTTADDTSNVSSAPSGETPVIKSDEIPTDDASKNQSDSISEDDTSNENVDESQTNELGNNVEAGKGAESKDFDDAADHDQHHDHQKDEEETHDEDESKAVPIKDYDEMSLGDMVKEASFLLKSFSVLALKEAFGGLRDAFRKKSDDEEQQAKEKFLEEGGNEIDFRHENRHNTPFFDLYTEYRSKVDAHYKEQQANQEANLKEREAIIEALKALYTEPSTNNREIFKKFRDLKTRWHNAGRIPKAQAGNIFKTYYFHLDNFNEFLDLNQELRKMDYEHNLDIRKSIIERAHKLLQEDNVQKALNELQYLHRMWKEEAVPVAEEHRETTWQEFKEVTGKIHDRKTELNEQILIKQAENLEKKRGVIAKISTLIQDEIPNSHNAWQRKIKEMKTLRDEFFALGRVPREENQATWDAFKDASREFNHEKNSFYKKMKEDQMQNLEKKQKLVEIALEHKDSTDWNESVKVVKRIQSEWKKIGHVPRKFSDKIWKEFSAANNQFFDRYKNRNNEKLEKQQHNLEMKEAILKEMEKAEKPKEKAALLEWLNNYSIKWSAVGYVPNGKQSINKDFSQLTEGILTNAGLSKDAVADAQWDNQVDRIKHNLDDNSLRNLKYDLRKQMDEVQKEVTQLQTNLAFFSNADENNPLFKNAIQNIENKVAELKALESKLDDLKLINLEALAESQKAEAEKAMEASEESLGKNEEE